MPNRLGMRNIRALPNQMPNDGGTISVQFEARTSESAATADVRYSVAPGFPFRITAGGSATPDVTTDEATIAQDVTLERTSQTAVSFVQINVSGSIPGDVRQTHPCFVWIDQTLGEHVAEFRENAGISRAEFAERIGVKPSLVTHIETGRFPSPDLEAIIARVLR